MLNEQEIKKLLDELKTAKEDVSNLKKRLNKVNKEKEDWFSKKTEIGNQIKEKINFVKSLKSKRNSLTNKVKDLKKERDTFNTKISSNIKNIVDKKKSYSEVSKDAKGRRISPSKIKAEIDSLNEKIETQPMNFDSEQKIMKRVKQLKKQLESMGGLSAPGNLGTISKETDELKKQANKIHKTLQDTAKESQDLHEDLITKSKEIDELKKQEEESYKKFFDLKKSFTDMNKELKDKLKTLQEIKAKLDENKVELFEDKKHKQEIVLKEKAKAVEEKISKKKKLTTEDLLIIQRQ